MPNRQVLSHANNLYLRWRYVVIETGCPRSLLARVEAACFEGPLAQEVDPFHEADLSFQLIMDGKDPF